MSLLPPIALSGPNITPHRSPIAVAGPAVPPVTAPTMAQNAVQQVDPSSRTTILTQRDTVPFAAKRNRLVGPPPTFELNLLQHMREMRFDPRQPGTQQAEGPVADKDAVDHVGARVAEPQAGSDGTSVSRDEAGRVYQQLDTQPARSVGDVESRF